MKNTITLLLILVSFNLFGQTCIQNTNSINFTGNTDISFSTDNNLQLDSTITIEAWIRATTWGVSNFSGSIVCKHSWSIGSEQGYVLRAGGSGQLSFTIGGEDTLGLPTSWLNCLSPTNAMNLNTWYHVAGSYDGDTIRTFINGVQVGFIPFKGTIVKSIAYPISIGSLSDQGQTPSRFWNGNIDEVRIWNRALTETEIASKMSTHLDTSIIQQGLVGYYRFNEGSGTTITDLTSSGNNGTLNSGSFTINVPFNQSAPTPIIFAGANTLTSTLATTYQWNLAGLPISGAINQSYIPIQNGSYTVTVTDTNGCSATSLSYFVTNVGLSEVNAQEMFSIQQTENTLTILSINGTIIQDINLINMNGAIAFKKSENAKINAIDLSNLSSGIYILSIITSKGIYNKRVSINK